MKRFSSLQEDLRQWFNPNHPKGGWKRINSKGEAIGPCAREPGEPKPKCMSNEKRAKLSKKERASAVAAKRRNDPNPERKGKPINVSNFGKGKISENVENLDEKWSQKYKKSIDCNNPKGFSQRAHCQGLKKNEEYQEENMEQLDEKNVPTSPEKWAQAKAQAKAKFDVYPSAYANGWAAKKYKSMGGGWKSVSEENQNLEEEDAYDKDAKPSDKPHDKEAAEKRAKIAAVMARKKMTKEEVTEQHAEKGRFRPTIPYKVPVSHIASPRMGKPDEMKESKDDKPPFDGPYTKSKGTVTDKSGAKHGDMSRARHLARQAMQKQAKPSNKLKEEASRKAQIVKAAAKKKKTDSKEDAFQAEPELSSTITKNY